MSAGGARSPKAPREVWNAKAKVLQRPLIHGSQLLFHDEHGHLMAVDSEARTSLWKYPWPSTYALLHDEFVLTWPTSHEIHAIDPVDGRPSQSLRCPRPGETGGMNADSSAFAFVTRTGVLIGRRPDYEYGGSVLFAFDLAEGRRLWSARFEHDIREIVPGGDVVVASLYETGRSKVATMAYDLATGLEVWRRPDLLLAGARVFDGHLVGCLGTMLGAMRLSDGATQWEVDDGAPGCLHGDRYYCCDWRGQYTIAEAQTGRVVARHQLSTRLPRVLIEKRPSRPIAVSETNFFVGSDAGILYAFDRESGEYAWSHQPRGASGIGPPVLSDGLLFYTNGFHLYCLALRSPRT